MGVANVESQKAPAASKQLVAGIAELLDRDCRVAAAKPTIADAADNRPRSRSGSASTSTRTGTRTSSIPGACARSAAVTRTNSNSSSSSSCPTGADPRARAAGHNECSARDCDTTSGAATATRPAAPTAGHDDNAPAAR
jgi:hypothetical protein